MAIRVTEAKKGMVIRYEGDLFQIEKYEHVTPGNWRAINHIYMRNLKTGKKKELRMNSGDSLDLVFVDTRPAQYVYRDANGHVFMDNQTYEQFHLDDEILGDTLKYVPEGSNADIVYVDETPLTVQLPTTVVLEVIECEEAVKGDTVSNIQKMAKVETGLELKVPSHIKVGEKIKIQTDSGEFAGRAND